MPVPVNDKDVAEQIARLYELHKSGALTDAEFENAKQRVLENNPPRMIAQPPPVQPYQGKSKERSALFHIARGCWVFVAGLFALIVAGVIATAIFGDGGGGGAAPHAVERLHLTLLLM